MGQFYGTSIWDPVLILAQIVSVQCLFYLSLCTALYLFLGTSTGGALTVEVLFDYRKLVGAFSFAAFLTSALAGSLILYFVVERTKKCLDFTCTCYLLHLVFCWGYGGFPLSLGWWVTIGVSAACMTLVGESLCMKKELRDIPTALPTRASRGSAQTSGSGPAEGTGNKRQRLINFLGR